MSKLTETIKALNSVEKTELLISKLIQMGIAIGKGNYIAKIEENKAGGKRLYNSVKITMADNSTYTFI